MEILGLGGGGGGGYLAGEASMVGGVAMSTGVLVVAGKGVSTGAFVEIAVA